MSREDLAYAIRQRSGGTVRASERGIRGWERLEYAPRAAAVAAIAAALECDVSALYASDGSVADDEEDESSMALAADLVLALRRLVRAELAAS